MKHCILFSLLFLSLVACERQEKQASKTVNADSWSNEAEVVFQEAEALKYSLEQYKLEAERLESQGLEGSPPVPRIENSTPLEVTR